MTAEDRTALLLFDDRLVQRSSIPAFAPLLDTRPSVDSLEISADRFGGFVLREDLEITGWFATAFRELRECEQVNKRTLLYLESSPTSPFRRAHKGLQATVAMDAAL